MTVAERITFVGDIHGDSVRLSNLLSKLADGNRRLVFLGDYIDHGPNSQRVLEILVELAEQRPDTVFLCGNHEIGLLAFLAGRLSFLEYAWMGGLPTIRSYVAKASRDVVGELIAALPGSHVEFLSACKPFVETDHFVASHAGVNPACPASRELADITVARHTSLFDQNIGLGKIVICGHYLQASHEPFISSEVACLNTGCGTTGGPATALLYPEMTILQA
jgi:serine/threonine protein phosphatase 1